MTEVRPETPQTDRGWLRNMLAAEEAEAFKRFRRRRRVLGTVKPEAGRWCIVEDGQKLCGLSGLQYFWPNQVYGPLRFVTSKVWLQPRPAGKLQITQVADGRIKVEFYA